jgi:hypothetical protein
MSHSLGLSRTIRQLRRLRWTIPQLHTVGALHLAPPFLVEDYIPRYQLLSSIDAGKKRTAAYAHLRNCNLCPRLCGVNRYEKTGVCLIGAETVKVNVIAPHFGEGKCCTEESINLYRLPVLDDVDGT